MGLIRKTFSVATLGVVSFRSKKEELRRAERARRCAEKALERERSARESAQRRIATAEDRLKHATGEATRAARRLEKIDKKNRPERGRRTAGAIESIVGAAEPLVHSGAHAAHDAGARVGRARKAAGRSARKATKQTKRSLRKAAKSTREFVDPVAARVTERVGEAFDQVSGH